MEVPMRWTRGWLLWAAGMVFAGPGNEADTVVLDNGTMRMVINRHGGAVSSCTLAANPLNPFSWKAKRWPGNPSLKEGLFLCFDRVGKPSASDLERGIPFHGEAAGVPWTVLEQATLKSGGQRLLMQCSLPLAGMTLTREYHLFSGSSACRITDRIRNDNPFRKSYNVLQHPSLAAPFLDRSVIVDCNASKGFINVKTAHEIPGPAIRWPEVEYGSAAVNLRRMTDGEDLVANYVCGDGVESGWGTVSNPSQGLLAGCLWPTRDYPWIRIWREWDGETPKALGIEFGTTPLGIPLEEIEQVGSLLGRPVIEALDTGAGTEKSFYLFLAEIPEDYAGTGSIMLEEDALRIQERGTGKLRLWQLPLRRNGAVMREGG
jgi:hypothetical protein